MVWPAGLLPSPAGLNSLSASWRAPICELGPPSGRLFSSNLTAESRRRRFVSNAPWWLQSRCFHLNLTAESRRRRFALNAPWWLQSICALVRSRSGRVSSSRSIEWFLSAIQYPAFFGCGTTKMHRIPSDLALFTVARASPTGER